MGRTVIVQRKHPAAFRNLGENIRFDRLVRAAHAAMNGSSVKQLESPHHENQKKKKLAPPASDGELRAEKEKHECDEDVARADVFFAAPAGFDDADRSVEVEHGERETHQKKAEIDTRPYPLEKRALAR